MPCEKHPNGYDANKCIACDDERFRQTAFARMTTRDWFAGMALQGILASPHTTIRSKEGVDVLADLAYETAEAMMRRRER